MTREEMRERARWIAAFAGYPIFYVFCFVTFTSLFFPYEVLKERIVLSFNAQQASSGSPQELHIDELTSSWITGVKAIGVSLSHASTDPKLPPVVLAIDEARASVAFLPLLIGHKTIDFSLKGFGGDVDGTYSESGTNRSVEVNLDAIDIGQIEPVTATVGLPMEGHISGKIMVDMPEGKATKGTGTVTIEGTDVAVGDGKAKLKGALPLPRLVVGGLSIDAEAKDGILKITKFAASGKDVEIAGDGRILMRDLATESVCDINLRFKINDGYRGKTDVTKNLFGAPGSTKPGDIELFVPEMKAAKRPDGFFGFHVRGLLGNPKFEPASTSAAATGGMGGGSSFGSSGSGTGTAPRP
ncbi:MAG: type II secretion system protein GspN [Polyangiaceae bacterium]